MNEDIKIKCNECDHEDFYDNFHVHMDCCMGEWHQIILCPKCYSCDDYEYVD